MVGSLLRQISIATLGHGLENIIARIVVAFPVHHVDKALMSELFSRLSQ